MFNNQFKLSRRQRITWLHVYCYK